MLMKWVKPGLVWLWSRLWRCSRWCRWGCRRWDWPVWGWAFHWTHLGRSLGSETETAVVPMKVNFGTHCRRKWWCRWSRCTFFWAVEPLMLTTVAVTCLTKVWVHLMYSTSCIWQFWCSWWQWGKTFLTLNMLMFHEFVWNLTESAVIFHIFWTKFRWSLWNRFSNLLHDFALVDIHVLEWAVDVDLHLLDFCNVVLEFLDVNADHYEQCPDFNKLKTTPTPNKNGSYGIKGGIRMP